MEENNTNTTNAEDENVDSDVVKQFKIIIIIIFIGLLIFLGFFIYNLIKCYLPKWMNKRNRLEEETNDPRNPSGMDNVKIEFETTH